MCNTLSEIPPGEPASVGDERACACVPRTERQEESPRNAAAPSRARGSPLGLFVWAASITEQHSPRYTTLTAPLGRCCHKDCSQKAGWGLPGAQKAAGPVPWKPPADVQELLLLPCRRCRCHGGAAGTGTPAPGAPRGRHVLPPGGFVPRAAAQPGPGAKLILQLRAVAQRQGPAAAPRRVPRWPAAVPAPGAPAPWGALRCCSGFYCLNTAKQQQSWCRAAAGSWFVTRNTHGSLLGSISSSCQQSSATAPQAGGRSVRKAQPLPVSDGTARTDAHESCRKAFRHRLHFAF